MNCRIRNRTYGGVGAGGGQSPQLPDVEGPPDMVHSTDWAGGGGMYPVTDVILEWHLLQFRGNSDPGRARANGWELVQTLPYVVGGTSSSYSFWIDPGEHVFLAIGIGFNGGAYGVIDSALVGFAIDAWIDTLADPEMPVEAGPAPKPTQLDARPLRSSGRR